MQSNLNKTEICNMLPHAGDMCLLDSVDTWNEEYIVCIAKSHRQPSNPLRNANGLPMSALIEYGAQAMAVHGCLLSQQQGSSLKEGYLVALRDVKLVPGMLSEIDNEIKLKAVRIYAEAGNMIYTLQVHAGENELATARATVFGKFEKEAMS